MSAEVTGRIAVFAGPTLPPAARPADPAFVWLAPARAGDAYALRLRKPAAVVLIDGLFGDQPAIRHKELLSLIAGGIPVIGGASMGALRAAELAAFGMVGVGAIFRAFASGRLTGDDEVAVAHAPAELDFAPLSEALVNVRATIARAVRVRVAGADAAREFLRLARRTFYKDRTWAGLIAEAEANGLPIAAFGAWLPEGRVDLKALDAAECLDAALCLSREPLAPRPSPPQTVFAAALERQTLDLGRRD